MKFPPRKPSCSQSTTDAPARAAATAAPRPAGPPPATTTSAAARTGSSRASRRIPRSVGGPGKNRDRSLKCRGRWADDREVPVTRGASGAEWGGTDATPKDDVRHCRRARRCRIDRGVGGSRRRHDRPGRRERLHCPNQLAASITRAPGTQCQRHPQRQGPWLGRAHGGSRCHQPFEPRRRRSSGVAAAGGERRTRPERGLDPQCARRLARALQESHRSGVSVSGCGRRERQRDVLRLRGVHGISLPARPKHVRTCGRDPVAGGPAVGATSAGRGPGTSAPGDAVHDDADTGPRPRPPDRPRSIYRQGLYWVV